MIVTFHAGLSGPSAAVGGEPSQPALVGRWETSFGPLQLEQGEAGRVRGKYASGGVDASLEGRLTGRKLTFTYKEGDVSGEGEFEFAPDGRLFTGRWRQAGTTEWGEWNGTWAEPVGFAGLWETSYGRMRLSISAGEGRQRCQGVYQSGGICEIDGAIEGRRFTFKYKEADGTRGKGAFELHESGEKFSGQWTSESGASAAWTGERVTAAPGVNWLIVMEAHWERGLTAPAYSYGEMLRTFFQRVPSVVFRHRFVHDLADIERFGREIQFIAEPVVLYFSSHGSPAGLSVGGSTVKPGDIGRALRGASNIRLLHFGACEVMRGDAPKELAAALGGSARFPISGYLNAADWGGSAIVDFTYLVLVIEHGLSPSAAVKETWRTVSFSRTPEKESAAGPMRGSNLTIYEP